MRKTPAGGAASSLRRNISYHPLPSVVFGPTTPASHLLRSRVLKKQLSVILFLSVCAAMTLSAQSTLLFQTTQPPAAGGNLAGPLTNNSYLGNYFVLSAPAHIDSISTYGASIDGGTIFGAIMSVPNLTSLPSGTPFGSGSAAPVVVTTLQPTTTAAVVSAPVSADLPAGTYIIVFGAGDSSTGTAPFGATSKNAVLGINSAAPVQLPSGWNQVAWTKQCNNGTTSCWFSGFNGPSPFYFAVTGSSSSANGPTINSISPNAVAAGGAAFQLTVTGTNFATNATVSANGTLLSTAYVSATQLTATVPANLIAAAGTLNIVVTSNNQVSSAATLTVGTGTGGTGPTISSISPTSALPGSSGFILTVNGTGFNSSSTIYWNSSPLITNVNSTTQLTAQVTSVYLQAAGSVNITVQNTGPVTSNVVTFTIGSAPAVPNITSLSPSSTTPGGAAFTLTVNGTNFSSNSAIQWGSTLLATSYVNTNQLTAQVPATLITNAGTANITVITPGSALSNAVTFTIAAAGTPTISSLSPATAAPGGAAFTLTVNGSNFANNSAIQWNGALQATTFVSATQLTASIPANLIAAAGTASINVVTPSVGTSNTVTFTIAAPTGPNITSLSPNSVTPGSAAFILIVNGSGFTAGTGGSVVLWNNTPLATSYVSSTQLQANVSNALIQTAGTANITVANGSSVSNTSVFTIGVANTPTLSSLSPNTAVVGSAQLTLTLTGTNFASGATAYWNGGALTTTFVTATQLTATVPASLLAAVGTAQVTVVNPTGTSTTSNQLPFTITAAPSPSLTSLSPASATAGGAAFTLTVNGLGFLSGATVRWNGGALTTTFVSASQLTAQVPATLITSAGTATVTAVNPGNATSNSLLFTISSSTTSNTIFQTTTPPTPVSGASTPLSSQQFLGNFFVLTSPTHIDSIGTYAQALDGGTIFGAIVAVSSLTSNPSGAPFDGTTKATAILRPGTTTSVVSGPVSVDLQPGTYVVVFGSGYYGATSTQAATAQSNGTSSGIPSTWNQVSWGSYCPSTLCWTSNFPGPSPFYFVVTGSPINTPSLAISNLSPTSAVAGSPSLTLTVTGTGFVNGSAVQWNGSLLTTTYSSGTQLTASVPSNLLLAPGAASVTVLNPGGALSNAVSFSVTSPVSLITSLNPATATAGGPAFTLTVNGSGFQTGSVVLWNGSALNTTVVSATQMTANVPASLIAAAGSASVSVLSPGGAFSNSISFVINASTPNITSLSPTSVAAGSSAFTLTVNGSGFLSGAVVQWSGTSLVTNYVSGAQLTANVPANLIVTAGGANILVTNPNGAGSNIVQFTITPAGGGSTTAGLAHYAVGQNWTTGVFVINTTGSAAQYSISFLDDNGNPAVVPFASGPTTRLTGFLTPYGSAYFEAASPASALTSGWAQVTADSGIVVQSLFRSAVNGTNYEAAVPSSPGSKAFQFPFDATNFSPTQPFYTGIALANLDANTTAVLTCTARDQGGNTITNGFIIPSIRPSGHWAGFQFPLLTGLRGTVDCTSTTNVAVVALRFIGTDSFSSLPVIRK